MYSNYKLTTAIFCLLGCLLVFAHLFNYAEHMLVFVYWYVWMRACLFFEYVKFYINFLSFFFFDSSSIAPQFTQSLAAGCCCFPLFYAHVFVDAIGEMIVQLYNGFFIFRALLHHYKFCHLNSYWKCNRIQCTIAWEILSTFWWMSCCVLTVLIRNKLKKRKSKRISTKNIQRMPRYSNIYYVV